MIGTGTLEGREIVREKRLMNVLIESCLREGVGSVRGP